MRQELTHLFGVYAALIVLLALTTGSAFLHLGHFNSVINMGIAVAKAALIYWFFMELKTSDGLVRLGALCVIFWLFILFGADAAAWLTRSYPS